MLKKMNRRSFLKKSILTSAGTIVGLNFKEKTLFAANTNKTMPVGRIDNLKISRLICGGNLISGYSHSRDLKYIGDLMFHYFTDEKIMDTFELCEENGINTFLSDPRERPLNIINRYWNERGGEMQWIAEGHPKVNDITTNLKMSIDNGASAIYIQGGVGDKWIQHGRVDLIGEAVSFIKENGLIAGVGSHSIEVPKACEKAGIDPDFYMKTLHHSNYWSATPREERKEFNVDSGSPYDHDNIWCIKPEETIEFMKRVNKPWLAFKALAAGAIHPRSGFKYAFENGADFVVAGMFDFQVEEDVLIAKEVLLELEKTGRDRPWRA